MTDKILVLAANPQDTVQLLLNREIWEIDNALERGKYREQFSFRSKVAFRVDDLQSSLQKEAARIVHFCGQGMGTQGLVLETSSGKQQLLDTQAIADLFKLFKNQIECVVLNACYSQVQAAEISKHINYVFGTKREIRDDAAIAFSKGFYEALGNGYNIEQAYEFGRNRIQLEIYGSSAPERKLVPVYSAEEGKYIELPEHEVIELLVKEPLNQIENQALIQSQASGENVTRIINIQGGNYNENIQGNYYQQYREAVLQREFTAKSPYKGLKRFNAKDKDLFFGRERLISKLIQAVNQSNFVLVLGASGSGKSSVVRAGVIPQYEDLSDTDCYSFLFTPNRDPFVTFHRSLLTHVEDIFTDEEVEFVLERKSDTLTRVVQLFKSKHSQSQCLIFIDQFEELFTLCSDLEIRSKFIQSLVNLTQDRDKSVKLILAMRSDFLEELATYPQFARIAEKNLHLVADMEEGELRQAIEEPAAKQGIVFEAGLVEEIIKDVQGQAGSLPLLQYTLNLLWQNDDLSDRELNISTYCELGGVRGALQKHVNQIYEELPEEQKLATKQILLRLVDVIAFEQSEVLRTAVSKRAYKSEFTDNLAETVQLLVNKNLLISDDLKQEGQSTVEIAHEALLSSWAELKEWISDARNTISLNNRLAEDAVRWQKFMNENSPKANDELWGGSKLERVIELRKDGTFQVVLGGLSDSVSNFIDASIDLRSSKLQQELAAARKLAEETEARRIAEVKEREAAENAAAQAETARQLQTELAQEAEKARIEAENAAAEAEKAKQLQTKLAQEAQDKANLEVESNKKLSRRAWGLVAISLIAFLFGGTALYLRNESQKTAQRAIFEKRASDIKTKFTLSNQLEHLLESLELAGDNQRFNQSLFGKSTNLLPEVKSVLYQAVNESRERASFNGHQFSVTSVGFSPDGKYLVSGSHDDTVKLWSVAKQELVHTFEGHQDSVISLGFSPDGEHIVSGGHDNTLKLWSVTKQELVHTFEGHQDSVRSLGFSPDGDYIVSGSHDNKVKLWSVAKQELVHTFEDHQDFVGSVGFSPDGDYIVSGSLDKTVKLWSVAKQKLVHTFEGHQSWVSSVSFSSDGEHIVSGSHDDTVKLWSVAKQELVHTFEGHQDGVSSVSFSPDGEYIVSGSLDKTVKLWSAKQQELVHTFEGHQDGVSSLGFSPDGEYIVSGSEDKTVKLWSVAKQELVHTFEGHQFRVRSVGFSPDGDYIVSGGGSTVKLWSLAKQELVHTFEGHQFGVNSVDFSQDGKYIVSGSHDDTVKLWSVAKQELVHTFESHQDSVISVGFSPDGEYIVSGSLDKTVKLWSVAKQELVHTFEGHQDSVRSVGFSPDGDYIVSGSEDKTVKLWSVKQQELVQTFEGHQDWVFSISFSPDGKYIVSGSRDKRVKLWSVAKQKLINNFDGHQGLVYSVGFSPDGEYIVSGSLDKTVKLWSVAKQELVHTYESHQDSVISVGFSPDGKYIVSGSDDKTVKLWRGIVWQDWIEEPCKDLRLHPALVSNNIDSASGAASTCLNYDN